MRVAMLGNSYRYAYAPAGQSYIRPMGCAYLGQDTTSTRSERAGENITEITKTLIGIMPEVVDSIQSDTSLTQAQKDAQLLALAKREGLAGNWFERNQTLVVGGAVLVLLGVVAMSTVKRRRRRR